MAKFSRLDEIVLETLGFFRKQEKPPSLDTKTYNSPLVVWSGNGYYTGRILFRNVGAYFSSESEVEEKLKNISHITDVVVVSASGEKHAPIIVEIAKKYEKKTLLISSSSESSAKKLADTSVIMPKIREPYTYNTSTYFGYMLAENPKLDLAELEKFLRETLAHLAQEAQFEKYTSFCIVLPNQFVLLREMIETKFIELFGRKVARDVFTYEWMRHATTVVQDLKELFLCFDNKHGVVYGQNQIDLPIFDASSYAAMMLVSYFLVWKIQEAFPPFFDESIESYCERAKIQSGFNIAPWVEA